MISEDEIVTGSFERLMFEKGKCCICCQPLSESKFVNMAMLNKEASWQFPTWGNVLIQGCEGGAMAVVCDGCQEANEKSGVPGRIKYAIEVTGDDRVIFHDIEGLEDVESVTERDIPDFPEFFTGSTLDPKSYQD